MARSSLQLLLSPGLLVVVVAAVLLVAGVDSTHTREPLVITTPNIIPVCKGTSNPALCMKTLAACPEGKKVHEKMSLAMLLFQIMAGKAEEGKKLADAAVATAEKKGEVPRCLSDCASNIGRASKSLAPLPKPPAELNIDQYVDMKYFVRGTLLDTDTENCERGCPAKDASLGEKAVAEKAHEIWALIALANSVIE